MKIGELLVKRGLIPPPELEKAIRIQKEKPRLRLGEILLELGAVSERDLLQTLAEQFHLPFLENFEALFASDLATRFPFEFWQKWPSLPILKEERVYLVAADPLRLPRQEIETRLETETRLAFGLPEEIQEVLSRNYWRPGQETLAPESKPETAVPGDGNGSIRENLLDLANKAPVIRLVNQIIFQALQNNASDIHIQPQEKELRIRYRIDGMLHDAFQLPATMQPGIISRIKILSSLNIAERRLPQDGRTTVHLEDRAIDIRVSVLPTYWGEASVLRLLDQASFFFTLEHLGLDQSELDIMQRLISADHGIILLTGPTGSGKTTTLYAALQKINYPDRNIVTLEDPVEYQIPGLSQIQVNPKIGLTFANGLRSILRHDPDVLMIGEIRDRETAEMAIQASLTGHLVFSTLHTNDAASAITRLLEIGIEPYLVSSSLLGIIAQRLVRLICPNCREAVPRDRLPAPVRDGRETDFFRGRGCEKCFQTGYRGRTAIFEFLALDDHVRQSVLNKQPAQEIKEYAVTKGMRTLRAAGEQKVRAGLTTLEEVLRVAS
ncbi:MAG: Type II secretion system protein E [candidate division TA06 bacterium ADurb.Bin417]|uniref:Type II secretion system protein E n=1 Tax=candidate division TA06 bacterium ADurb.Bin417 TaxID=1852828 RepID=A0A1V5MGQ2_UNCT6|nr:MAG: Type II secretion system protein E [candidate division TA06 bacterium ADurb.Bin417]